MVYILQVSFYKFRLKCDMVFIYALQLKVNKKIKYLYYS